MSNPAAIPPSSSASIPAVNPVRMVQPLGSQGYGLQGQYQPTGYSLGNPMASRQGASWLSAPEGCSNRTIYPTFPVGHLAPVPPAWAFDITRLRAGDLDISPQYIDAMGQDPLTGRFCMRNLQIPPLALNTAVVPAQFTDPRCFQLMTILATSRASAHGSSSIADILKIVIGETMAPCLPDHMFDNNAEARKNFVRLVVYLFTALFAVNMVKWTTADYDLARHKGKIDKNGIVITPVGPLSNVVNLPLVVPWPNDFNPASTTPEDAMDCLLWYASGMQIFIEMAALETIVTTHLAFAKRGTVSTDFLTKIIKGVQADLGKDINLDAAAIKSVYIAYGEYITGNNARDLFHYWSSLIPRRALRLRLTIAQTAMEGLTQIVCVMKAYSHFPDFSWDRVFCYFPAEQQAIIAALLLIDGNQYYGYNKDLGIVRASLYKNISYVSKELLIHAGGEFGGWPRTVEHQAALDLLVADYVNRRSSSMLTAPMSDHLKPAMLALSDAISRNSLFLQ